MGYEKVQLPLQCRPLSMADHSNPVCRLSGHRACLKVFQASQRRRLCGQLMTSTPCGLHPALQTAFPAGRLHTALLSGGVARARILHFPVQHSQPAPDRQQPLVICHRLVSLLVAGL